MTFETSRSLGSRAHAGLLEEALEHGRTVLGHHAADDLQPMIQPRVLAQLIQAAHRSRFWIVRPEHESSDPRVDDRARAHRAWFERHVQARAVESPASSVATGLAHRDDLRVPSGVVILFANIEASAE